MASTFFGLHIGSSALSSFQVATNTTANNIANVKTTGYTRQAATLQAKDAINVTARYGSVGTGVTVTSIKQQRDLYYDNKYWENNSCYGRYEQKLYYMEQIQNYFKDNGSSVKGFSSVFSQMFSDLDTLRSKPSDKTVRNQFISSAQSLCTYFNQMSDNLSKLQDDCNEEIKNNVDEINSISEKISLLNKEINQIETGTGVEASSLRDERANLIDSLSKIVNVSYNETEVQNTYGDNLGGTNFSLYINGEKVVEGQQMIQHCPVLIVLLPLTAALLCLLFSKFNKNLGSWLVIGSIAGSLACSLQVLHQTLTSGEAIHYWMGNWEPPLGIEFVIDPLSAVMAVLITFISLMVAVYSKPFMRKEDWLHIGGYYTLYGLLTVGLCGMVITGDMFNLYVYLEVMSLSGYGLIAMGGKKSMLAAFRYMLIGTIGASLYLISVAYLYAMTGTLNMADLGERIMPYLSSPPFALAVACLFIGFGIKMALFPLHGWQPDAYNFAHPGSAAFIAGVMSKVPAYAIIRLMPSLICS